MIVLGVTSPYGYDNAAAILVDGKLVGMVEEERLNRIKHAAFMPPAKAIAWCLEQAGCTVDDVDVIAIGFSNPRTLFTSGSRSIAARRLRRIPLHKTLRTEYRDLRMNKHYAAELYKTLGIDAGSDKLVWVRHHLAHAASAFFLSPFEQANIISLDGNGGEEAGLYGVGVGTRIDVLGHVDPDSSWGWFYERFTLALGFRPHNDEGKVMGLAAYGDPAQGIFPFVELRGEGGWPSYDRALLGKEIARITPRERDEYPINDYHEHIAARAQLTLEAALARAAEELHERTGLTDLCLAGGTALNCSCNGKLLELPFVERLFVQPAASDSGTALGAAVHAHVMRTGQRPTSVFDHAYWGPEYSNDEIEATLKQAKTSYRKVDDVSREAATMIANDKIVGWFQGRMEVGPRALGSRSILANPGNPGMKDAVNNNVKFREPWRPFAPSILAEQMEEYFGTKHPSPFMILAFQARPEIADRIPAALHVDGTGRPQSVDKSTNPRYWHLIDELRKLTGTPVVLNTSFNVDSEPIVCTPKNALATFSMSGMDALAIGDFIVEKAAGRAT
jgi:carbamoyltransferase